MAGNDEGCTDFGGFVAVKRVLAETRGERWQKTNRLSSSYRRDSCSKIRAAFDAL